MTPGPTMNNEKNYNEKLSGEKDTYCRDFLRGICNRQNCRFLHETPNADEMKDTIMFCHDFQNKGCYRSTCKFLHCTVEEEEEFFATGKLPPHIRSFLTVCKDYMAGDCRRKRCKFRHPRNWQSNGKDFYENEYNDRCLNDQYQYAPRNKMMRYSSDDMSHQIMKNDQVCKSCETANDTIKLLHDNMNELLKKVADLTQRNSKLATMNEILLEQSASFRGVPTMTSSVGSAAPTAIATVSVAPVVSLAGLVPPAQGLISVSTAAQLMSSSGALIVTSAGAPQLMAASSPATLVSGAQAVVITPQHQYNAEAQLVHRSTSQQITISNSSQQISGNQQPQAVSYPIIQSNIIPH